MSYGSFKKFKISASEFGTMGMHRQFHTCACEFLTIVTKGVVRGVYKVVIRSSFSVTRLHKVSGGIGRFAMSHSFRRRVDVNAGCFSVTNICSTIALLLLTVKKSSPISGSPPVV